MNVPYPPDNILCNPVRADGSYVVISNGVCSDYKFIAGDVEITTWSGLTNKPNYKFRVAADGTVTLTGEDITWLDCTDGEPPPTCEQQNLLAQYSGYETAFPEATPEITCWGQGIDGATADFDNSQANMTACAGDIICSVQIVPGVYSPNQNGICQDHTLVINGTTVSSGDTNSSGSYNYMFTLNDDGTVEETSEQIPQVDCTVVDPPPVDPPPDISCDLEVIYLGDYLNPVLYMTGGGVVWEETFDSWVDAVDENGDPLTDINGDTISDANGAPGLMLMVAEVYPYDFIVNMDMTGNLQTWLVYQTILPGENLYVNGVLLDQLLANGADSNNLTFTINEACEVATATAEVDIIIDLP